MIELLTISLSVSLFLNVFIFYEGRKYRRRYQKWMEIDYKTNLISRKQVDKLWDESEDRVKDQIKNLKKSIKKRRLEDCGS